SNVALPRSRILAPEGTRICEEDPTCLILSVSIRTNAGSSRSPVRGSSSRPALTRVRGAADLAPSRTESNDTTISANNVGIFRPKVEGGCWRNSEDGGVGSRMVHLLLQSE